MQIIFSERNRNAHWIILSIVMLMACRAHPVQAQAAIVLAERQAERGYAITKSACFVMLGVDNGVYAGQVRSIADAFEADIEALRQGDPARGLERITSPQVVDKIALIAQESQPMLASARQIAAGDFHSVALNILLTRNGPIADQWHGLMQVVPAPEHAGKPGYNAYLLTRRQATVAQELLRDLCYLALEIDDGSAAQSLGGKMANFEEALTSLIEGDRDAGIPKAPTIQIKLGLRGVLTRWANLRGLLEKALSASSVEVGDVQLASVVADSISSGLAKVAREYEKELANR